MYHITYNALNTDNRLFYLSDVAAWKHLTQIGKKAKIGKKCNPHALRHSQATDMVLRGYQESVIRKKLGWSGDSKMIARYQHIADEDVINATAEMTGAETARRPITNMKQADPLKIADAAATIARQDEEIKELRQELSEVIEFLKGVNTTPKDYFEKRK